MKDRRLLFHVHGRKFYLSPPRRPGGPYYIRFGLRQTLESVFARHLSLRYELRRYAGELVKPKGRRAIGTSG